MRQQRIKVHIWNWNWNKQQHHHRTRYIRYIYFAIWETQHNTLTSESERALWNGTQSMTIWNKLKTPANTMVRKRWQNAFFFVQEKERLKSNKNEHRNKKKTATTTPPTQRGKRMNPINTCENVNFMQNLQEIMWLKQKMSAYVISVHLEQTKTTTITLLAKRNENSAVTKHKKKTLSKYIYIYVYNNIKRKSKTLWIKYIDFDDTKILSALFFLRLLFFSSSFFSLSKKSMNHLFFFLCH